MRKTLFAVMIAVMAMPLLAADGSYPPTDAERARWTMQDMDNWKICFAAYKQDHGKYPEAKSAEEVRAALEPIYISHLPMTDAWGHPYVVESSAGVFMVVSAGADGKLDKLSWSTPAKGLPFDADAVATNEGRWLSRQWVQK